MLFDLRARGRRRTVQVVYFGLALLFLVGFIGFGVGVGGGGGGVFQGVFGGKEGSAGSGNGKQLAAAEARVKKHPSEASAWAALVEARFRNASGGEFYDEEASPPHFTEKGKEVLAKVVADWNRYQALKPGAPSLTLADDMVRAFGKEGLNEPAETVAVLQLVIPTQPSNAGLYGRLAEAAYQSKNVSTGDLASQKAIELAPPSERARVKTYMESLKKNPNGNGVESELVPEKTSTSQHKGAHGTSSTAQGTTTKK